MATEQITLPLEDAQMLLNWMEQTFGNDAGVDWLDEEAGAVADALYKAIDNFKAMRAAMPVGVGACAGQPISPPDADGSATKEKQHGN